MTGYIISGVLIGPYVLNLIPEVIIERMDFVTDAALAFIAFGVGKYFKLSQLRKSGAKIFIITAFESLTAALLVTLVMIFVFHLSVPFALLLGAIGSATAPASTIMTIRQYKAKGEFVNTILQVVALDDAVALLAFSVCAARRPGHGESGADGCHRGVSSDPRQLSSHRPRGRRRILAPQAHQRASLPGSPVGARHRRHFLSHRLLQRLQRVAAVVLHGVGDGVYQCQRQ